MTRAKFDFKPGIPVFDLLLDTHNARIRIGEDQNDCVARIMRREAHMLNLMRDIAKEGLSTNPILVSPTPDGKWIVRDGNRRVTALKLLNQPDLIDDPALIAKIGMIKATAVDLPETVDVFACDDEAAMRREMLLRHNGEQEGVGQMRWSAYLRTIFLLDGDEPDPNRRAAQYALWAEEQGLLISDDFPITTLTRLINVDTLASLGFKVEDDELVAVISVETAKAMANRVIVDLETGTQNVNQLFTTAQQQAYVARVRQDLGLEPEGQNGGSGGSPAPTPGPTPAAPTRGGQPQPAPAPTPPSPGVPQPTPQPAPRPGRPAAPRKPSWERPRLFPSNRPGFDVPRDQPKAHNLVGELQKLQVTVTPISVAVLLRALIEISEARYRSVMGLSDKQYLHKNIIAAAEAMVSKGQLTKDQCELVKRRAETEGDWLNIRTLQKYVHSPDFHPNQQVLNTFWDEIGCFVAACWRVTV